MFASYSGGVFEYGVVNLSIEGRHLCQSIYGTMKKMRS